MNKPAYLPNLLSSLRIVLAPAILGAAYSNSQAGFTLLTAFALGTDWVDGYIARRWSAGTPLGRNLDRWGDVLTMSAAAAGVALIWPNEIGAQWTWVLVALAGVAADGARRFVQAETAEPTSGWLKVLGGVVPLTLAWFLAVGDARPFQAAAVLQFVVGVGRFGLARRDSSAGAQERAGAGL